MATLLIYSIGGWVGLFGFPVREGSPVRLNPQVLLKSPVVGGGGVGRRSGYGLLSIGTP